MPRKAKDRPEGSLRIEGLSDGREIRPVAFVDDFNGLAVPMVQDTREARALEPAQVAIERKQRQQVATKRALLESVGLLRRAEPMLVPPKVAGKRAVAIELGGEARAMMITNPPWLRV